MGRDGICLMDIAESVRDALDGVGRSTTNVVILCILHPRAGSCRGGLRRSDGSRQPHGTQAPGRASSAIARQPREAHERLCKRHAGRPQE
jgi:hypothetical protein